MSNIRKQSSTSFLSFFFNNLFVPSKLFPSIAEYRGAIDSVDAKLISKHGARYIKNVDAEVLEDELSKKSINIPLEKVK